MVQVAGSNVKGKDLMIPSGHVVLSPVKLMQFKETFPEYKDSEANKQMKNLEGQALQSQIQC